ncbi:Lea domain protein [Neofusicoccum parvum]|nr:Lea domain protein [Neofusicoccum parvum]
MLRATIARNARLFTTSTRVQKSTVDSVKDTAKKVDRTVADELVKGIEKGEQAAGKIKEATGVGKQKADGAAAQAKGKANEVAGEAKGKAHEVAGKAKGAAEEAKGKL